MAFSEALSRVGVNPSGYGLHSGKVGGVVALRDSGVSWRTLSNFVGQLVVEKFGHVTSLLGSLFLSVVPLILFAMMPETLGLRTAAAQKAISHSQSTTAPGSYVSMT